MKALNLLSLMASLWLFTCCIDLFDEEEDKENPPVKPAEEFVVNKISQEILSNALWDWGIAATEQNSGNIATFTCTPDTIYGGYLAMMQNSGQNISFSFDEDFRIRSFSKNSTGYVVQYQDTTVWITTRINDAFSHQAYHSPGTCPQQNTPFGSIAASIEAFRQQIDLIQPWFSNDFEIMLQTVLAGEADTLAETNNGGIFIETYGSYVISMIQNIRTAMFGNADPKVGGFNVEPDGTATVKISFSGDLPAMTYRHGQSMQASDTYGEEIENKIYCGVLIGDISRSNPSGMDAYNLTLGNCTYNIAPVPVSSLKEQILFTLPKDMPVGDVFIIRPYLISESDAADMQAGYPVNPFMLEYGRKPYPFYNIEARIESIEQVSCTYHETSDLMARFKVKASIQPKNGAESQITQWGIAIRDIGDNSVKNMFPSNGGNNLSDTFDIGQQIYRSECEIDESNYRATKELEFLIYVDIYPYTHYFVPCTYTVVYDEKPSIRYTKASLTTALCDIDDHNVMEDAISIAYEVKGAFWLDDGMITYWDSPEGLREAGVGFTCDVATEYNFFYSHFLFKNLRASSEYLMGKLNGKDFPSSNRLTFTWSGDKVSSVKITE